MFRMLIADSSVAEPKYCIALKPISVWVLIPQPRLQGINNKVRTARSIMM